MPLRDRLRHKARELTFLFKNTFRPRLYNLNTSERVGVIYHHPTDMCETDRLMLFALVRGLRPNRALEIGSRWGGSARIITNAMEENGFGQLIGIDPNSKVFRARQQHLHRRYALIAGYSPQAIPLAVEKLGGNLDFVFIDGLHIYDAALADFRGCLPYLADGAHVVIHDAFHQGVAQAVQQGLEENPEFIDCGFITRNATPDVPVAYQGLRLVRKGPVQTEKLISEIYTRHRQTPPPFSCDVWNYDIHYNRLSAEELAEAQRLAREWTPDKAIEVSLRD